MLALLPCVIDNGAARRHHDAQLAHGVETVDSVDGSDRLVGDEQDGEVRCGREAAEQWH